MLCKPLHHTEHTCPGNIVDKMVANCLINITQQLLEVSNREKYASLSFGGISSIFGEQAEELRDFGPIC